MPKLERYLISNSQTNLNPVNKWNHTEYIIEKDDRFIM